MAMGYFGFRKYSDCTIYVAITKALISCVVTMQLMVHFVFTVMQKSGFFMTQLNQCGYVMINEPRHRVGKMPAFKRKVHATGVYWHFPE